MGIQQKILNKPPQLSDFFIIEVDGKAILRLDDLMQFTYVGCSMPLVGVSLDKGEVQHKSTSKYYVFNKPWKDGIHLNYGFDVLLPGLEQRVLEAFEVKDVDYEERLSLIAKFEEREYEGMTSFVRRFQDRFQN